MSREEMLGICRSYAAFHPNDGGTFAEAVKMLIAKEKMAGFPTTATSELLLMLAIFLDETAPK